MIKKLKHELGILRAVAFVTYKEWSAYRTHSLISVFVGPVYFIVQYFIWQAVYSGQGTLGGMAFDEMIRYFGAMGLIGYLTMDFADWNLQMLVRTGKFLTFSLRPIHHRFYAFSQKVGHRILGFFIEFLPCLFIFLWIFKIDILPTYPIWTVISIILAFLMNFYINYILGMSAFWLVQTEGMRSVWNLLAQIFSGTLVPLVFFPKWLQLGLFFLPFQYTSYVPAMVWMGRYTLGELTLTIPQIVGLQLVAVSMMFILSEIIYRLAMKQFTGVGA